MKDYTTLFSEELEKFHNSQESGIRWIQLERLHILSQLSISKHYSIHFLMLFEAIKDGRLSEICGQIIRIILVLPGHIFGRLPIGNVGTTRISAFKKMPIPKEFEYLFHKI